MLHRGFFLGHYCDLTLRFLAKSEVQSVNSGIEKTRSQKCGPSAVGGGIRTTILAGSLAVQCHLKANGLAVFRRPQDEVKVATMEPEYNPSTCGLRHCTLLFDLP